MSTGAGDGGGDRGADDGSGKWGVPPAGWIGAAAAIIAAVIGILPLILDDGPSPSPPPPPPPTSPPSPSSPPPPPPTPKKPSKPSGFTQVGARPISLAAGSGKIWVADPTRTEAWWLDTGDIPATTYQVNLRDVSRRGKDPIRPVGVAVADGTAWFVDERHDLLWSVDEGTRRSASPVHVARSPAGVAVDADVVWVVSRKPGRVRRIDANSVGSLAAPIELPGIPQAIAARDGVAWVIGSRPRGAVWRISGNSEPDPTTGVDDADPVAVAATASAIWVADASGSVLKIDPAQNVVKEAIRLDGRPCGIAANKGAVWVTDSERDLLWKLNPEDPRDVDRPIRVEARPCAVALYADAVWVGNLGDNSISRVQP